MTLPLDLSHGAGAALGCPVTEASELLATQGELEALGAIFTRIEVVECILDLVGYTSDQPLHHHRLLEPAFGEGDFLLPAARRLLQAWQQCSDQRPVLEALGEALRGVELHRPTFNATRDKLIALLKESMDETTAVAMADRWLIQHDFLLLPIEDQFDYVVGNPPYVRQERIPPPLLSEYRRRYRTLFDRADLYIPFLERSLQLLSKGGHLGFICADRWMKNKYGGPLRAMIAEQYRLKAYIDMMDTPAFHSEVMAYPAITILSREKPGPTRVAYQPEIDREVLNHLASLIRSPALPGDGSSVRELAEVTNGVEPWLLESADQMALVRRLEARFPKLEDAGCKVGIGVATGADRAFIADYESMDVESDRKLPLVTPKDILSGEVEWKGLGVINPFSDEGGLVDLRQYPKLAAYLEARREAIAGRHVARKAPERWYRTIDRIFPALAQKPKLLIPDIKGQAHIVYEKGELYPHHNLYYVTSETWDLRALQAVLRSAVARLFVATYSTRMRGGFLRFQAQYLRRIRLPIWSDVSEALKKDLTAAANSQDLAACNLAAFKLYGLSEYEQAALGVKETQ